MEKISLGGSGNEVSFDFSIVEIGSAEQPLALFIFVLSLYGETSKGRGLVILQS